MRRIVAVAALAALCVPLSRGVTQKPVRDRVVEGRVRRADAKGPTPVAGSWIVLHRVGTDTAAPLDSVRSAANGNFSFRYSAFGAPDAIYFVSTMYRGIAYFSSPLRNRVVQGGEADLLVYDTTTVNDGLIVEGRHVVVSAPRNGKREIAEIFEIGNEGQRTVVPRDSTHPIWSAVFPAEAESLTVAPGDLAPGAVAFRDGRGELYAPVSPGVRQLVVTYRLPFKAFPVSMPLEHGVAVLEVLLEEPRAVVEGAQLAETAAADIDGRMFRRFVARAVGPPSVIRIKAQAPSTGNGAMIVALAAVMSAAMIGAFVAWNVRRARRHVPTPEDKAEAMVALLARHDAEFEKRTGITDADRRAHAEKRERLKEMLAKTIARDATPS